MNSQERKHSVEQKHRAMRFQASQHEARQKQGLMEPQSHEFSLNQNQAFMTFQTVELKRSQSRKISSAQTQLCSLSAKVQAIHERALSATERFKSAEAELIDILGEMEETRRYLEFKVTSIYAYGMKILKLSADTTYNLIAIARKSRDVPALKEAIRSGATTASKARKVISVISKDNQDAWLKLLSQAPARKIEKEVARVNPRAATPERLRYTSGERLSLEHGVNEDTAEKLKRVQDLVSQSKAKPASHEDALEAALNEYLDTSRSSQKSQACS